MTWNLKKTGEKIKESKELIPFVEFLKEFEEDTLRHQYHGGDAPSEDYYTEKAKELKKLIERDKSQVVRLVELDEDGYCDDCDNEEDLFKMSDWNDCSAICKDCMLSWLQDKEIVFIN